ncbi:hypothetical protein C0991_002377 [Blastosporella zonata]|nr:hypothetical protein C0991_002377 [Blastosporella zonata]
MPEKSVDDVTISPTVPTYASSEQGLQSPTNSISTAKEDLEDASRPLPTFPEGGLQAWLTVLGGFVSPSTPLDQVLEDAFIRYFSITSSLEPLDLAQVSGARSFWLILEGDVD